MSRPGTPPSWLTQLRTLQAAGRLDCPRFERLRELLTEAYPAGDLARAHYCRRLVREMSLRLKVQLGLVNTIKTDMREAS